MEGKIQTTLRNLKNLWSKQEYPRLAPSCSKLEQFFGTVKSYNIGNNDNQLTIRPLVSILHLLGII